MATIPRLWAFMISLISPVSPRENSVMGINRELPPLKLEKARFVTAVEAQEEAGWTIAKILEEMLVLNVGHEYSYTRDELIEFIDAYWSFATGEKSWSNETDEKEMEAFIDAWMVKQ